MGPPSGAAPEGAGGPGAPGGGAAAKGLWLAQLREARDLLDPEEVLESRPERLVVAAPGGSVRLEIDLTNFEADGEPHVETAGRNIQAVLAVRRHAVEAARAAGSDPDDGEIGSLVEFVRAFREFFQEPQVLLAVQAEMDLACHVVSGGDAGRLLRERPSTVPLQRSREADPPPDRLTQVRGAASRVPLRLLGRDDASGTVDLRLDIGVSAEAGDNLGVDMRLTVPSGYPRNPVGVEALEAWGGGEAQQAFVRALVEQAQAVARVQAAGRREHFCEVIQGLHFRILCLSRECDLSKGPLWPRGAEADAGGGGGVEADTGPGRAATKGWAPLHGRRVAQVRCGCFFREESLKRYIAERLQAGVEPADIKCPGVMPGTALFPAQKCPQNLAPHRLLLP